MSGRSSVSLKREKIYSAIFDAAVEQFSRHGLSGTSTKDIAAAAGLSKAQLHYYIRSKEELYREVLLQVTQNWKDVFPFEDVDKGAEYVLNEYLKRKISYAIEYPKHSRLFASEIMSGASVLKEVWADSYLSFNQVVKVLEKWMAEGEIKKIDAKLFVINTWALTQHYADYEVQARFMLDLDKGEQLDRERIFNALSAMVVEPILIRA